MLPFVRACQVRGPVCTPTHEVVLLPTSPVTRLLACAALLAAAAAAQQLRAAPQICVIGPSAAASTPDEDPGAPVEMFENPNLDNYLRRSQSLLERGDFAGAIGLLQDVIEGRTVEVVAVRADEQQATPAPDEGPPEPEDPPAGRVDARQTVFSPDGRIFRPVGRLCQELLAQMPEVGVELYRTTHEYEAEQMLEAALEDGSIPALEQVANRYFITLPAGRAMVLLADRLMHAGRYRGAVQVLRDLLEVYPEQNRERLGVSPVWCEFKIALCLQLAGDVASAKQAIDGLAEEHAEESLRISGQLESIRELPTSSLFARDTVEIEAEHGVGRDGAWLADEDVELVPLWQYRFADEDPYKNPKPKNGQRGSIWIDGGARPTQMPFADRYGPATWVSFSRERRDGFVEPRALFLENFCLRMTDAASGLLLNAGDGAPEAPAAREGHPRVRIAAVDNALLRPVEDDARRYVVMGHSIHTSNSDAALKSSELVAYDKQTWERTWSSSDWLEGEDGLRGVTFLAAPTVFGTQLLIPSLRRDAYTLECLDRVDGRPRWHTPLHAGGTEFFKAPGTQVEVLGGTAYVLTNAGCIAAVDAFAGDLRWARRYERLDPIHKANVKKRKAKGRSEQRFGYRQQFAQAALDSFAPADLIAHEGKVVLAPCDGDVLMAVDAATGEPVWMLDANTSHAPYGRLEQVVGAGDGKLFVTSRTHLVCVELDGGLVRWMKQLPSWAGPKMSGRGRGAVVGGTVVLPDMRELLLFDVDGREPMRRLALPTFGESREPLQGSANVAVSGAWLALGFRGGVEVFSTAAMLRELAAATDDGLRKASYLTQAGDRAAAAAVLSEALARADAGPGRAQIARRLLSLVREQAARALAEGGLEAALSLLDDVREPMADRELRLNWHLARVELCKASGDLRAHEREQQQLYAYMEGR